MKQDEAKLIEVRGAIYLTREARSRQFDRWMEELTASAKVTIGEEALEQIEIPPPATPADAAPPAP